MIIDRSLLACRSAIWGSFGGGVVTIISSFGVVGFFVSPVFFCAVFSKLEPKKNVPAPIVAKNSKGAASLRRSLSMGDSIATTSVATVWFLGDFCWFCAATACGATATVAIVPFCWVSKEIASSISFAEVKRSRG